METQGTANTICDLHGYSDAQIIYKQLKDCPIDGIYCTAHITSNQVGLISCGGIVGDHRYLWIEFHERMLLIFQQNSIIPPMARNLHLEDPRKIKNSMIHPTQTFSNMIFTRKSTV